MAEPRNVRNTLLHEKRQGISGGLYHRMQVDFAYNSNHIEGSRLTHEQTRFIFETHALDGPARVNDILEAANHFRCFDHVLETLGAPLTEDYIKQLHRLLKTGLMGEGDDVVIGGYKRFANVVGQIATARPADVPAQMQALLADFARRPDFDLYDAAEFHARFERIHPFYDGNGRIGRLLLLKQCLEHDIVPVFITEEYKLFYYIGLQEWQLHGRGERLVSVFLSMQDDMKRMLDFFEVAYDPADTTARALMERHEGAL